MQVTASSLGKTNQTWSLPMWIFSLARKMTIKHQLPQMINNRCDKPQGEVLGANTVYDGRLNLSGVGAQASCVPVSCLPFLPSVSSGWTGVLMEEGLARMLLIPGEGGADVYSSVPKVVLAHPGPSTLFVDGVSWEVSGVGEEGLSLRSRWVRAEAMSSSLGTSPVCPVSRLWTGAKRKGLGGMMSQNLGQSAGNISKGESLEDPTDVTFDG